MELYWYTRLYWNIHTSLQNCFFLSGQVFHDENPNNIKIWWPFRILYISFKRGSPKFLLGTRTRQSICGTVSTFSCLIVGQKYNLGNKFTRKTFQNSWHGCLCLCLFGRTTFCFHNSGVFGSNLWQFQLFFNLAYGSSIRLEFLYSSFLPPL